MIVRVSGVRCPVGTKRRVNGGCPPSHCAVTWLHCERLFVKENEKALEVVMKDNIIAYGRSIRVMVGVKSEMLWGTVPPSFYILRAEPWFGVDDLDS